MVRHLNIGQLAQAAEGRIYRAVSSRALVRILKLVLLLEGYFVLSYSLAQIHCYGSGVRGKKAREKGKE